MTRPPLATEENLARLRDLARGLGVGDVTLTRVEAALQVIDRLEAEHGPLDDLKLRRLLRAARASGFPRPAT